MSTSTTTTRTRTYITIDGVRTLVTNRLMMEYAINALVATDAPEEIISKARDHMATIPASTGQTPTAKINAAKAIFLSRALEIGEEFTLKRVCEILNIPDMPDGRVATNAATPIVNMLINSQKVIRLGGRPTKYRKVSD